MKIRFPTVALLGIAVFCSVAAAQSVKRTFTKTERFDFGPGGTISIIGAPVGAIRITGTNKREIEITAEIELSAPSEAEINQLAQVTTFLVDPSPIRTSIITTGTHNKVGDKKFWKKFPTRLLGLPFRIDYTLRIPRFSDLSISGGKGDFRIDGVEGVFTINFIESKAQLNLVGGTVTAIFGSGTVDVSTPDRSWRGTRIEIALAEGEMNVNLPNSLSAELSAALLRSGKIENSLVGIKPRDRNVQFDERSILARAGSGGVPMKFTVGDGTLRLRPIQKVN